MSRQVKIMLPDPVLAQLQELAVNTDQTASALAAQIVRNAVALAAKDGKVRPLKPAPLLVGRDTGERPVWLEPYGGDPAWRQRIWGAIVALHGRYPRQLEHLKHGWWNDETHTEILAALATWRQQIDETAQDPREELAFHHQLTSYTQTLRQQGGGVSKTWKPGAAPDDWDRLRPQSSREP
jgi:hypothetical protein